MISLKPHDIRLTVNPEIYPELYEKLNMVKRKSRGDLLLRLAHDSLMGNFKAQNDHVSLQKSKVENIQSDKTEAEMDPEKHLSIAKLDSDFDDGAFDYYTN